LILARADEGVTQDLHAIDLDHCVESIVQHYRVEALARNLTLTVHSHANQVIYGYPEQVTRVVSNLIENALRYTLAGGSIDIKAKVERGTALIEVTDTGVGIAREALDRVFDRFWRGGAARAVAGSGLGLAIARSLARAHGGDVWVRSRLGEGSTFTIRLPLRPPQRVSEFSTIS
jgi:two-component system, OmpR family, manganese sensing sensor histidine kinase